MLNYVYGKDGMSLILSLYTMPSVDLSSHPLHLAVHWYQGCYTRRKLVWSAHLWLACGSPRP